MSSRLKSEFLPWLSDPATRPAALPWKCFAIAAEDRYRFDLESKAYAFALAGQLPLGKHQLAINLLPGSLYHHPDAVGWLMDSLLAAGLRPDQVLIEVTKTEVITCFDQFRKVLKALRVAGMKLAIDDFGAGYSGLSLLTRFQPDKIKVDAELVRDIHISGTKQAIVHGRPLLRGSWHYGGG